MRKTAVFGALFFTIFVDFFNLGLIYPLFTSLVFEGQGSLIPLDASSFYKNCVFGLLIAAFPFGQFLGAPYIGQLSDRHGRRKLLLLSLLGTIATLLICALGTYLANLPLILLGRFLGGVMAGNMTLAYASLADLSPPAEKVKNFALVPLAIGLGFALGPYLAAILMETTPFASPVLPLLFATLLGGVNFGWIAWKFPEMPTLEEKKGNALCGPFTILIKAVQTAQLRPYLFILFLMISANLLFCQFVGPLAIDRLHFTVLDVGYLYANIGFSVALGHLFLTPWFAKRTTSAQALGGSLTALAFCIALLLLASNPFLFHLATSLTLLACAVAYTNAMALVSNQAAADNQGEIMGVAVSVQSLAEFLPATLLAPFAAFAQTIPIIAALFSAVLAYLFLRPLQLPITVKKET